MEIKDFVSETLRQIKEATADATTENDKFYLDVDTSKGVHFDLAVVTMQETSGEGGAKIQVAGLMSAGGGASLANKYEQTSRIQFNVKHRDLQHERQQKAALSVINARIEAENS